MRLLLLSNSGSPFYEWCKQYILDFLPETKAATFISAATTLSEEGYFETAQKALPEVKLTHLILNETAEETIAKTESFLVGGGNTYLLLSRLKGKGLLPKIKERVNSGAKYIGLSAGANIAGPNILTTNDWNVIGTTDFASLGLVPFNINPHYIPPHDKRIHSGETREERIKEYLTFNENPVVGIEENTFLKIENNVITVGGQGNVFSFHKGSEPEKYSPGESKTL